jgi:hypothetical protein
MSTVETIITVASWEPRFLLGTTRLLERGSVQRLLMYYYQERAERTAEVRTETRRVCTRVGVDLSEIQLSFSDPAGTWTRLKSDVGSPDLKDTGVLVDITTMPRETIWAALFWLQSSMAQIKYAYHRPASYGAGWLARDPDQPRFGYKLAGAPDLNRATALLAVTGFDADRALQAIEFFEPVKIVLAVQTGNQFGNAERNVHAYRGGAFERGRVTREDVDAYAYDHGYSVLRRSVECLASEYNIILCSFGPKLSAIALYRLQREFPESALAHIHCRDYSREYSAGIGDTIEGELLGPTRVQEV